MDRREFMTWMGVGGLAASLPVALAACQSQEPAATTETPAGDTADAGSGETTVVGTVSDLDANGFILNESAAVGPVLVVGSVDALNAVNPTCTHAGCTVEWNSEQALMVCPCHGSQFNADGSVKQGPAAEPLPTYAVQVEGDNIIVS